MFVYVNQSEISIPDGFTVTELIKQLGYHKAVVVWVNDKKLLQGAYPEFVLKENDQVKIIRILGGG